MKSSTGMFFNMATVKPRPGREKELVDRMRAFADSIKNQPGMIRVHVLSEVGSNQIVGISMWTDEESFNTAMSKSSKTDPSPADSLRSDPPLVRQFVEI
jgi:heme-degrading monooxygenase HmoA